MSDIPSIPFRPEIGTEGVSSVENGTGFIPALPEDEATLQSSSEIIAPIETENDFSVKKHNKK